ncbi:hypothetical protein ACQ4M3_21680 [Leptolyngbya sp. AN03gr2]|uniref:hypothetical protein n=1 Tax=unclassified Leptolyngbya TaxID=2650499 RepID=UPI003D312BA6
MTLIQLVNATCGLSLCFGIHFASISPVHAQIEPPPSSGAPSGTVGGGSRS